MRYAINKGLILTLASNADVYARGEKYYKDKKVLDINFDYLAEKKVEIVRAKVAGTYKQHDVTLTFAADGLFKRYGCNCDGSTVWRGTCKHVVAAMLALLDQNAGNLERRQEERAVHTIAESFESQFYEALDNQLSADAPGSQKVTLSPTLIVDGKSNVCLELKVGYDRLYVVRNIKNFMAHVQAKEMVAYGKGLSFRHTMSAFDARSQGLLTVLGDFYNLLADFDKISAHFSYRSTNLNTGDQFLMLRQFFDQLFEVYKNTSVKIVFSGLSADAVETFFEPGPPEIKFSLAFHENKAVLKSGKMRFHIVEGEKYYYIFMSGTLYRVERQNGQCLFVLLTELNALKKAQLVFAGSAYNKFVSYVLPMLRDMDMIAPETVFPSTLTSAPMQAKLYFDATHKSVLCKLLFCYADAEVNPLDEETTAVCRNTFEEARVLHCLARLGFVKDLKGRLFVLSQEEQVYDFYADGLGKLKMFGQIFVTDAFTKREIKPVDKATFGVRLQGDLLSLTLGEMPYSIDELLEALASYSLKKRYHRLKDGAFINLEDENFKAYADILSTLDISKKDTSHDNGKNVVVFPAYRALHLDGVLPESGANVDRDPGFLELVNNVRHYKDMGFDVPASLDHVLRPYQKIGYQWLRMLSRYGFSGILADEMGLGKTVQVISVLLSEKDGSSKPSMVVTPTSLMYNWAYEIEKFAPALEVVVLSGLPQKRLELLKENKAADVFITTYDTLKRDIDNYDDIVFNYVVADEAQYIKNPATQNAVALKKLKSRTRFALTGTPIENSLSELWSIFDFIMPGYLYSASKFVKVYETPIIKDEDDDQAKLLQKQIAPFILRRMKSDVLKELPEKVETTLYAEMEPEQKKIYAAHLARFRDELAREVPGGGESDKLKILSLLTRLRQICCHPATFIENYNGGSGKLDLTIETILSAVDSGHRVLLFSQFTAMLGILMKALTENHMSFFYLDGATEARLRMNMAEKFNNGEKNVFLVSLKAGGTGLNLTGADIVIHYDQWWNPAVMNQASDRAHRYGQKKVVQVINVVTKNTIEERILALQSKKKELADAVLMDGIHFISKMSVEELKTLFLQ